MFHRLDTDGAVNRIYYTSHFARTVDKLSGRDRKGAHKVVAWLNKLSERFPNKPEMWEKIRRCKDIELFELKPKPYRVAVLVRGNICLCVHLWKVERRKGRKKEADIETACAKAREVYDEFVRFVKELQERP